MGTFDSELPNSDHGRAWSVLHRFNLRWLSCADSCAGSTWPLWVSKCREALQIDRLVTPALLPYRSAHSHPENGFNAPTVDFVARASVPRRSSHRQYASFVVNPVSLSVRQP